MLGLEGVDEGCGKKEAEDRGVFHGGGFSWCCELNLVDVVDAYDERLSVSSYRQDLVMVARQPESLSQ